MTQYKNTHTENNASPTQALLAKEVLLPKDTNNALREVMKSITNLAKLYAKETTALNATDTNIFMDLQEEKLVIARMYQNHMAQMLARKDDLRSADPTLKQKLKDMHNEFCTTSQKNTEALTRMQRCTERLGNTVRLAAIRSAQSNRACSYGETGAVAGSAQRKGVSAGMSETV
ncbi:MAG: hypothetical protein ACRBCK_05115 [Alphaproteobacteria bacterium]